MLFNSYIFVLFFLPMCILGYFILNYFNWKQSAQFFLLGMSFWFYGYFNIKYLLLIICSIVFNYIFYCHLNSNKNEIVRKSLLLGILILNTSILFYFKYYNFFLENINTVFKQNFALRRIILPLGISFFTFQQISFVIDAYRREVPQYGFLEYASFVTFFPQLIAGPIVKHDELIPQFRDDTRKQFQWDNFARGIYIFSFGLAKKVLLADTFGNAANWGFGNIARLDSTNAILTMLSYTIQIYFDFSGYCDMAIGIGKMLNIDLPLNFNSPYKALNITEFWQRWHITLTRFFTKYVYIPLGGNRRGGIRTCINIIFVFLVSGLWHGAAWTFILWGICHGIFYVIMRWYKKRFNNIHPALNWLITFSFINATWVIFRANNIQDAICLLKKVALFDFGEISINITSSFNLPEFMLFNHYVPILTYYPQFYLSAFFAITIILLLGSRNAYEKMQEFIPKISQMITTAILLVWCILSFSGVTTFLYYNF